MIYIKVKYFSTGALNIVSFCVLLILGTLINDNKEQIKQANNKTQTTTITTTQSITITSTVLITTVSTTPITSTTTTTTAITTTEVIKTECIEEYTKEFYNYETNEHCEEYNECENIYEKSYVDCDWYIAKWYSGSIGSWGYSGRELISGYSVATPDFPQGTILQITGGGLDGTYRVDDTGCPSGVIDFFYNYGDVPEHFKDMGVYDIQVSIIS